MGTPTHVRCLYYYQARTSSDLVLFSDRQSVAETFYYVFVFTSAHGRNAPRTPPNRLGAFVPTLLHTKPPSTHRPLHADPAERFSFSALFGDPRVFTQNFWPRRRISIRLPPPRTHTQWGRYCFSFFTCPHVYVYVHKYIYIYTYIYLPYTWVFCSFYFFRVFSLGSRTKTSSDCTAFVFFFLFKQNTINLDRVARRLTASVLRTGAKRAGGSRGKPLTGIGSIESRARKSK